LKGGEKMPRMREVETKVLEILKTVPESRDNDNLLLVHYLAMIEDFEPNNFVTNGIIENSIATKLKSVERCRRKLQADKPELRGSRWEKRHEAQADFVEYSRGGENF
jgi:hypothetical protein